MSKYSKFLIALSAAFGTAATATADGAVSGTEGAGIGIAFAGAVLVWLLPNKQP